MITPIVGQTYLVRHASGNILARCTEISTHGGFDSVSRIFGTTHHIRATTRYHFINLRTNREIVLRSRQKILAQA